MIFKLLMVLGQTLESIGKPFYKIITLIVVFLLLLFSQIEKVARGLFSFFQKTLHVLIGIFTSSFAKTKNLLDKIDIFKIPSPPKIHLPKIPVPKLDTKAIRIIFSVLFIFGLVWFAFLKDLPSAKELITRDQEISTKIYDRNGILLYKIYKDQNRSLINLEQIPDHVILATLAAEDAEFYSHPGFSIKGILRAIIENLKENKLTGGSTITQQLVKNALLSSEKTIIRKIRELILAIEVELVFTKDEILEMYLNEVSYGGTAYGIREAAEVYFDKEVQNLNLAEAAFLAGLPKSPTKFSPYGPTPEAGLARQKDVINLMVINKYITPKKAQEILDQALDIKPKKIDIKAPHFVMYVRNYLDEKYGASLVEKGGLEVTTTLDYSIQLLAEEVVSGKLAKLKGLNVNNAGVIVIKPSTGDILAMVGSKDYFDLTNDGNVNVTTSVRNPGSSIKVVNYAYALANGYSAASILKDTPITFKVPGQPPYSPKNYDNQFRGNLSLRSALAESRNVAAVKVLASYGVDKMLELGREMGISTWTDPSDYGLSLTLGGGGVKLVDLAQVYSVIANYGNRVGLKSVDSVVSHTGKVLETNDTKSAPIISPHTAYLLIDILKDNVARTPAFGSRSMLVVPNYPEVVVKTGTSNELRDNLTVGFNQNFLIAVWVGNNDNSPMARVASGVTGAAPIWNKIMSALLSQEESEEWAVPKGLRKVPICSLTGTLPCSGCPVKLEWFIEENIPLTKCNAESVTNIINNKKPKLLPEAASTTIND